MRVLNTFRLAALAVTSGLALGGCAYGFGDPYGSYGSLGVGYGNYGYGNYGYGYGYPYSGYGYGYGSPYGGYGSYGGYYGGYGSYSPFGWYDNYYYPGTGIYVYDRERRRHQMTDTQRRYWQDKFSRWRDRSGTTTKSTTSATTVRTVTPRENWSGFTRSRSRSSVSTDTSSNSDRGHWRSRSSASTTSSSSDTTSSRSRDNGRHGGRGSKDD